jgi:dTDP-4-amino-4,6-dideoxygalactose transaminase
MTGMSYRVPFNRPSFSEQDQTYLVAALRGGHAAGDGPFTARCNSLLEELLGIQRALLTTNCTHALEMAAMLLDLAPGDEVIMPSFTFVSTANAFALRGAKPVFADIRPDTLNIDEAQIERLITSRTRAIVVVHYAGVGCEMDAIMDIATRHGLAVVEDNAHGLFGRYREQLLGTFGQFATQSFHETKNFTCGEGGALLINDPQYLERAEIIREKGTNRARFFRGQVDKYSWVGLGSSYLPADPLAALLLGQLESRERIQSARRRIFTWYEKTLAEWASANGIGLPYVPPHCDQAYHMFYLLLPSLAVRQRLIAHLRERGILAVFHYVPLHVSEMGISLGGAPGDCPVTEDISDRLLRLPFYNDLSSEDLAYVTEQILAFNA